MLTMLVIGGKKVTIFSVINQVEIQSSRQLLAANPSMSYDTSLNNLNSVISGTLLWLQQSISILYLKLHLSFSFLFLHFFSCLRRTRLVSWMLEVYHGWRTLRRQVFCVAGACLSNVSLAAFS